MDTNNSNSDKIVESTKVSSTTSEENSKLGESLESFKLKTPPKVNKTEVQKEVDSSALLESIKNSLESAYTTDKNFQTYLKAYHKTHLKKLDTISDTLSRMEKFDKVSSNTASSRNRLLVSNRNLMRTPARTPKTVVSKASSGFLGGLMDTLLPFLAGAPKLMKNIVALLGLFAGLIDVAEKAVEGGGKSVQDTGLKLGTKWGSGKFGKWLTDYATKNAGKFGAKGAGFIGKKFPIASLFVGGKLGWDRLTKEGDWIGALGELASGVSASFAGIGTGVSVGIDSWLLGRDLGLFNQTKTVGGSNTSDFIKQWEGYKPYAYYDKKRNVPASQIDVSGMTPAEIKKKYGTLTIGYGRTSGVKVGDVTTKAKEESLFEQRVLQDENYIRKLGKKYGKDWNENQITALTSFAYNAGKGNLNKLLGIDSGGKIRSDEVIKDKMLKYVYSDGEYVKGLENRRIAESKLFGSTLEASTKPANALKEGLDKVTKSIEDSFKKTEDEFSVSEALGLDFKGLLSFGKDLFGTVFKNARSDFGGFLQNSANFLKEEILYNMPSANKHLVVPASANPNNETEKVIKDIQTVLPQSSNGLPPTPVIQPSFSVDNSINSITESLERIGDYIQT